MISRYQSATRDKIQALRERKRVEKSQLDYLIIALCPVLIMLLVGSLVFFLIQVFYDGQTAGGIRWVMFWFVMAIVLVARIGIEQSASHATIYGACLAVATWLYLMKTHPAFLLGIALLGLVWFAAHKLVTDCTLIDEDADSSKQGLLKAESSPKGRPQPQKRQKSAQRTKKPKAPRSTMPGRWVLYFSLAALPLYGLGQIVVRFGSQGSANTGLSNLFVYLAAACALLLATSFLGLRRYLRQRSVIMPAPIARTWLTSGAWLALVVLVVALFLPRPGAGQAWLTLGQSAQAAVGKASQVALKFNPTGSGEGREGREAGELRPDADPAAQGGQGPETGQNGSNPGSRAAQQSQASRQGPSNSPTPDSSTPDTASNAGSGRWIEWLIYGIFFLALCILAYRNRHAIAKVLAALWRAITEWFQWQRKARPEEAIKAQRNRHRAKKPKPFRSYRNPFQQNDAQDWSAEALIRHTYEALQSWASEAGMNPTPQETPVEQTRKLAEADPRLSPYAPLLGAHYTLLAYSQRVPANLDRTGLRAIWEVLSQH